VGEKCVELSRKKWSKISIEWSNFSERDRQKWSKISIVLVVF
jgi:hypothetical protein